MTTSSGALWLSRAVVLVAGVGLLVATVLGVSAFVRDRPIDAIALLFPAVAAVALGQGWGIVVLSARRPQDARRVWLARPVHSTTENDPRRFFFDVLPKAPATGLVVIAGLAWLAAMTAFPG